MTASVENLLHERTGLDVVMIGQSTVERAVKKRMKVCDITSIKSYTDLLETSSVEMMALIDEVVVPETWFFRDGEPFAALSDFVRTEWMPAGHREPIRLMSIPCSTGEEAYSIAITLYEAGLRKGNACIDAVDISRRSLETARRAVYGPHSFRHKREGLREHYFQEHDGLNSLIEPVRQMVEFHYGNLLEPYTLPPRGQYDVIFCRNLLIYFDKEVQQRALKILSNHLAPGGLLFLGHAEAGQVLDGNLTSLPHRGSFAFRKRAPGAAPKAPSPKPRPAAPPTRHKARSRPAAGKEQAARGAAVDVPPSRGRDPLRQVTELADRGQIEEAVQVCERHLLQDKECAQAYYLLGVLSESSGDERHAEQLLRKAVYLEPNHEEALAHLSLLAERNGDARAAASFRRRLKRITERTAVEKTP